MRVSDALEAMFTHDSAVVPDYDLRIHRLIVMMVAFYRIESTLSSSSRPGDIRYLDHHRRGVAYACLVVPLTVVVWLFFWQFGLITSVVAWGAAALAVRLYRFGSGWLPSRRGAVAIVVVVMMAVVASLLAAFVYDAALAYVDEPSGSMLVIARAIAQPDFVGWLFSFYALQRGVWAPWLLNLAIALLFSILGVMPTLSRAFRGEPVGRRVSAFLIPLTVVLAVLGLWSFFVVPADQMAAPATTLPYVVGDCLPESEDFATPVDGRESLRDRPVACDEPHAAEVVWAGVVDEPVSAGLFPGDPYFDDAISAHCLEAFSGYVGIPWEQSSLRLMYYYPSPGSWTYSGDRDIACAVFDPATAVGGSLGGAAR